VFERLAADGTTIFLTTHDMAEAERLADRVALLTGGAVAATGTPRELVDAHGGPTRLVVVPATPLEPGASVDVPGFDPSVTSEGVVFAGVSPTDIGDVVAALDDAALDFEALSWREPTLEDAYLELAGDEEGVEASRAVAGADDSGDARTEGQR
jgi:ABC-2 type transport system ATP-binding protein